MNQNKRIFLLFTFIFLSNVFYAASKGAFHTRDSLNKNPSPYLGNQYRNEEELINCLFETYKLEDEALLLICETDLQSMKLFSLKGYMACYSVSTSGKGTGNEEGSFQTPLGMHRIISVICNDCPEGTLIKGMVETRTKIPFIIDSLPASGDFLTTRILVLKGLDKGINTGGSFDSYQRGVVIHGTPEEGFIGLAKSKGCIRMYNDEIINLSRIISEKKQVYLYIME